MKLKHFFIAVFCICLVSLQSKAQCPPLTAPQLKEMLVQLGYTVKDLNTTPGKEKFEVPHKTTDLNIPMGYELSASTNFIWLTVNLGPAPSSSDTLNAELLKQNGSIQPCFFYITAKGVLMMAIAAENRGMTNAVLRRHTDKLLADVSSTKKFWQR